MAISEEHLGYTINYDEDQNTWFCWDADIHNSKSLKAVKAILNKRDADARRVGELPAFKVEYYGNTAKLVKITLYAEDRRHVWYVDENGVRSKESLDYIVPDTLEARKILGNIKDLQKVIEYNQHDIMTLFKTLGSTCR